MLKMKNNRKESVESTKDSWDVGWGEVENLNKII